MRFFPTTWLIARRSLHRRRPWFPELERQPRLVLGEPNNLAPWPHDQQRPPIQLFGVEGRYACALYSAASKLKQLDVVEKDLVKLQVLLVIFQIIAEKKLAYSKLITTYIKWKLENDEPTKHLISSLSDELSSKLAIRVLAES
uniref:ATP synthase subunit O, mitochondrial n=1 Tax=Timema bartmani TaxID=61472 RepID=A0A7R9HXI6_9NEOP|nr:unnamed protein product [Timema bartmani]